MLGVAKVSNHRRLHTFVARSRLEAHDSLLNKNYVLVLRALRGTAWETVCYPLGRSS